MIHPATTIRPVSPEIGNGVFATAFIPRGTIIVVKDCCDLVMTRAAFFDLPEVLRQSVETFMYHDKQGQLVLGWDHAKYMNHSCRSNTMMTDYGLEIVVRDIAAGEEVTTEYGLLNVQEPYALYCNCVGCRGALRLDDIDGHAGAWDEQILASLQSVEDCAQPLWELVSPNVRQELLALKLEPQGYRSVRGLKWRVA
ncbi:MAG: SET domain-containing protein [Desulfuromonadaceae bacterium]|nr:SET domain-containing protein [Desulfuromonadaceae bacterium]